MAKEYPKDDGLTLQLRRPGPAGSKSDPTRLALTGIMLLAFMVLLAACANLATIFAARAADRSSELAVRLAIGASRWTVLRQLLVEAVVVSVAGGVIGSLLARLLLGFLVSWQPFGSFPTRMPILPDSRVYLLAIALSLASGIFFGLLPARQVWRTEVVQAIKSGYVFSNSSRRFVFRDVLLIIQIVVCTVLVTASLVAVRGMVRAMHVPLGFQPEGVTLAEADLSIAGYTGAQALPIQKKMLDATTAIPGVTAVAISDSAPFANNSGDWFIYRWGTTEFQPSHMAFSAMDFLISPGYLALSKIPLIAGRDFTWHDDQKSPQVAIVNKTFARKLFGTDSAVGQRFVMWATAKYEVVGGGRRPVWLAQPRPSTSHVPAPRSGSRWHSDVEVHHRVGPIAVAAGPACQCSAPDTYGDRTARSTHRAILVRLRRSLFDSCPHRRCCARGAGPSRCNASHYRHLRHGLLRGFSANEGTSHPNGFRRATSPCDALHARSACPGAPMRIGPRHRRRIAYRSHPGAHRLVRHSR